LLELVGEKHSRISPRLAAEFLDISSREVYRWRDLGLGLWLPKLSHCPSINAFADIVHELREAWPVAIERWKAANLSGLPFTLLSTMLRPSIVKIMEDPELSDAERAELLAIRSLRILREEGLKVKRTRRGRDQTITEEEGLEQNS
jgi:hypothetical protein